MATVTRLRRPAINPPSHPTVRLVAAVLRCFDCKTEWRSVLDEWSSVPAESLRCPKCDAPEPVNAA